MVRQGHGQVARAGLRASAPTGGVSSAGGADGYKERGAARGTETVARRAGARSGGRAITADDSLPAALQPKRPAGGGRTLADVVDVAERQAIEAALRESDGSRERAAETLGLSLIHLSAPTRPH